MKRFLLIFSVLFYLNHITVAQDICATVLNLDSIEKHNPTHYKRIFQIEKHVEQYLELLGEDMGRSTPTTIRIPVVVHVLHNGEPVGTGLNIGMAQIQSQIDVLNADFGRTNADAANTPAEFAPVASAVDIEFHLACVDPNGNPTNGIVRTLGLGTYAVVLNIDGTVNETATGIKIGLNGSSAWPTDRYLNIWVCNLTPPFLGYAQFPYLLASRPNTDGVVVNTQSFGNVGNVEAPYDGGRIASHEVGHWLNLRHIWGNDGGCSDDDLVHDTPNQEGPYGECPTHPQSSCDQTNDMFMNYMDYTDDACRNLFTIGQRNRMRALFAPGGVRRSFVDNPYGMTLTGPSMFCTSANYTLGNIPTGAGVVWNASPSGMVTITGSGNSRTLTRIGSTEGEVTLIATASLPCGDVNVERKIWLGVPWIESVDFRNGIDEEGYYCSSHTGNEFRFHSFGGYATSTDMFEVQLLSYPSLALLHTQTAMGGEGTLTYTPPAGWYVLQARIINHACGTGQWAGYEVEFVDCTIALGDEGVGFLEPLSQPSQRNSDNVFGP